MNLLLVEPVGEDDGSSKDPVLVLQKQSQGAVLSDEESFVVASTSTPNEGSVVETGVRRVSPSVKGGRGSSCGESQQASVVQVFRSLAHHPRGQGDARVTS